MDEAAPTGGPSVMERLFESVQDEVGVRCPAGSPADDPPGVGVDDEGDVDEPGPGRDIDKISQPQTVGRGSMELSVHLIQRTGGRPVADRCPQRLASDRSPKAHVPHQPGDRAAGCGEALPPQLTPDLAYTIDTEVLLEHALDLDPQIGVPTDPVGQTGRIDALGEMGMIGRRGDRQDLADRLDPVGLTMIVDERDHGLNRRELDDCELRLGKISRRLAQDFIRLAELSVLTLQRLQTFGDFRPNAVTHAAVDLRLLDPLIERLRRAANLRSNRSHRRPPRGMILLMLENQPNSARAHLR